MLSVTVKTQTWERDSNGLYDYDSTKVTIDQFNFVKSLFFVRDKSSKVIISKSATLPGEGLVSIAYIKGNLFTFRLLHR